MTDGLIGSYYGRMLLCGILAFLGLAGSVALTLATHVRKGLPLTTQVDRVTGIREHGVGRWFVTFAAFLAGPWLLMMVGMTGTYYVLMLAGWVGAHWFVIPVAPAVALTGGIVWLYVRRSATSERVQHEQFAALPEVAAAPAVAPQTAVGWSMPQLDGQWDQR